MISRKLVVADAVRTPSGIAGNALLIERGAVVAIGDRSELAEPALREERYPGGIVVPGMRDAHFHPVAYASALDGISLKTAADFDDVARRLRSAADRYGPGRPVVAVRLDDESLAERRLPTRADLDAAVGDRPVVVHRYCGHIAVANGAALRIVGITAATPDPPGGVIDRDESGEPTGILRETAIDPISDRLADATRVEAPALNDAMLRLAGLGITSIGAMTRIDRGPWVTLGNEADILSEAAPELPIRVHAHLGAGSVDELRSYAAVMRAPGTHLRWAGLKRFADGSLGGHTAAMHEPFSDRPDETGTLRLTDLDEELARACLDLGGTVAIHAIGDRACGRVIDLFERLVADGADATRLRLEHASVLAPGDIARLAATGATASVQPAFMGSEAGWLEKRLGADRLSVAYPLASLEAAGVPLAGGSDCPVEPPDPWSGMALARDRAGIHPTEALSAESAFRLFTSGGAAALGEPEPLAVGSPADFAVIDRDPVTATPADLRETQVIDTWISGELVNVDRSLPAWME